MSITADDSDVEQMPFYWHKKTTIHVLVSDITKLDAEAIVTSTNNKLGHSHGLAGVVGKAAGPEVQKVCDNRVKEKGNLKVTETFTTQGYKMACKYIIHTLGPEWKNEENRPDCGKLLHQTFTNCLEEAEAKKVSSLAIPALSHGIFKVPTDLVAEQAYTSVIDYLQSNGRTTSLKTIYLVDLNQACIREIQKCFLAGVDGSALTADAGGDGSEEELFLGSNEDEEAAAGAATNVKIRSLDALSKLLTLHTIIASDGT